MRLVTAAAAAVLLSSCAATRFETPELSVVDIRLQQSDVFQQRLKVHLRVQNPNDRALPVKGITVSMDLNGEEFAQGVAGEPFTVPALGEAEFDMLLTANMAGAVLKLLSGRQGDRNADALEYRMRGEISLASGFLRSIPFEEKGTLKLADLRRGR
ncbi:MAG: LEA type 2 family protein [Steroidobacteraceae bacterium]